MTTSAKSSSPKTTIVVSNYNYKRYVGACLESCAKQTNPCKVIIVDDCSTDSSWQVIKKTIDENPHFSAIRLNANSGGNARGKNVGIFYAKTPYIMCLDSDDALVPKAIEKLEDSIEGVDIVHGKARRVETTVDTFKGMMAKKYQTWERYEKFENTPEDSIEWYKCMEASTILVRRNVYEHVGLFNEDLKWKIDREMWYRAINEGHSRRFLDLHVSLYRGHPQQITRNPKRKKPLKIDEKFEQIIRSYGTKTDKRLSLDSYNPEPHVLKTIGAPL
tara:strand:+ start:403345 stop:404169 length:825 start_codon:yes stop_codon:yes gene_type:complete